MASSFSPARAKALKKMMHFYALHKKSLRKTLVGKSDDPNFCIQIILTVGSLGAISKSQILNAVALFRGTPAIKFAYSMCYNRTKSIFMTGRCLKSSGAIVPGKEIRRRVFLFSFGQYADVKARVVRTRTAQGLNASLRCGQYCI